MSDNSLLLTNLSAADQLPANPISKKLQRILDSKIETDKETLEALEVLSEFYEENTLQNRRNLRNVIEKRSLDVNRQFLDSFRAVKNEMDQLQQCVNKMSSCCTDMTERLQSTKEHTHDLIAATTKLQSESKRTDKRLEIAQAFLAKFQLTQAEFAALKGDEKGSINQDFFPALERARNIQSDCKLLLRANQQPIGLQIMERMSQVQELAYEKLYRWIQRECRLLNVDTMEVSRLLCEAMRAMQDRTVLFKYCIDEYSTARRNAVVRSFIDALTRGGPGGVPKPIELVSHDPLRYISDMQAWLHQTIANEKELFNALLKLCTQENVLDNSMVALAHITDGICRPFKVRVEQVLSGENGPIVLYRLSNLFKFYMDIMKQILGQDASLVHIMSELSELTSNLFFSSLSDHVAKLLEKIEPPGADLMPVQGVHQVLLLLRDVLQSHDSTLVPVEHKQQSYSKILATVLDPLMQTVMLSATELSPIEIAVYMLNVMHALYQMLSLFEFTGERLEILQAQIDAQSDVLVSEQTARILHRTGFTKLQNTAAHHTAQQGPMSELPDASSAAVKMAIDKFDLYLASPDSYRLQQVKLLTSLKIREQINYKTADLMVSFYKQIYDKVYDIANLYENTQNIMSKTVEQVQNLVRGTM